MEVLIMLKKQGTNLSNDELKMLFDELKTGQYQKEYIKECLGLIADIKNKKSKEIKSSKDSEALHSVVMTQKEIKYRINKDSLNIEERFFRDLEVSRMTGSSNEIISSYIVDKKLDDSFFVKNIKKFNEAEILAILKNIRLDDSLLEPLLEKLPSGSIEKNQIISEDFFIKHFEKLDIKSLRVNKITDWILDESKRSKKLIIFLKMKGVNL